MTRRLYYDDSYLRSFRAAVLEADGATIYLDETAFYPTSGGQPFDTGAIGGVRVTSVADQGDRIAHEMEHPLAAGNYDCAIDWDRRFDHMQQHTGQHLLSAVLGQLFGIATVSVHIGVASTIDIDRPSLSPSEIEAAELLANKIVFENRPVTVSYQEGGDPGLRKASEREGTLRIVTIADLDRSACGGTHVRGTAEIGPVAIRRLDRVRGNVRVEFLCGHRAIGYWKSECNGLRAAGAEIGERLAATEKLLRRLSVDAARARGRELYEATAPDARGLRIATRRLNDSIDDKARAEAQSFTDSPSAVFTVVAGNSVLLAVSADCGQSAVAILKPLLEALGGRGGGNPRLAQGSLPGPESAEVAAAGLLRAFQSE
ncbi:MAG: hypothetical protein R2762_23115 [Bryobacteraceae bacterium]